jgi:protein-tyrosine phosphatase
MGASESKQSVADFDSIIPSTNIHTTGTISKIPQLSSGVKGDVHQASETKRGGGLHLDLLNVPIVAAPVLGYSEFENTISQVAPCLFVSGGKVAASRDILVEHSIQRIVNCCASTIPNYFESDSDLKYLGLKLLDAKEENINWFVAKVLCFINDGISNHENVLLHCEKGISRSCSFAIAYQMWKYKCNYIDAFSTVQQARSICNPNAGFICNLVELQYVLSVAGIPKPTFLFRYSSHSKYDPSTPLLKICMDDTNRKLLIPNLKYFKSYAVYAVVPGDGKSPSTVYLWRGNEVDDEAVNLAIELLKELCNFIGTDTFIEMVHQGRETQEFRLHVLDSEDSNTSSLYDFDDLVGHTNYGMIAINIPANSSAYLSYRFDRGHYAYAFCAYHSERRYKSGGVSEA